MKIKKCLVQLFLWRFQIIFILITFASFLLPNYKLTLNSKKRIFTNSFLAWFSNHYLQRNDSFVTCFQIITYTSFMLLTVVFIRRQKSCFVHIQKLSIYLIYLFLIFFKCCQSSLLAHNISPRLFLQCLCVLLQFMYMRGGEAHA